MRVLVVDDRLDNRYLLVSLFKGHGFQVDEARHGDEALAKARNLPPDLVVSDLLMPVMDGYSLLRQWRADDQLKAIPFVVYTATYTQEKDRKLALELGADAFVVKPTDPDDFMAQMRHILGQAQAGTLKPPALSPDTEPSYKLYSEVLVRKLESTSIELQARIEELTQSQEHIQRLNRLYASLSETNQAIVHITDPDELFHRVCRIAVECGGFSLAWIGLLDKARGDIRLKASFGEGASWFAGEQPFYTNDALRLPVQFAVSDEQIFLCNDLANCSPLDAYRELLDKANFRSAASLPLRLKGELIGAITLFAAQKGFFDDALEALVKEIAGDLSYALDNFAKEQERRESEERLKASEAANRLNARALEASANGVMICDIETNKYPIRHVNPAFERITGYSGVEVLGRDPGFLLGKDLDQPGMVELRSAIKDRRETGVVLRNYQKDGSLFWNELTMAPVVDDTGTVTHFVGVINDITERKRYEAQLERQYNEDALTGLASRNLLRDRVNQAIAFAAHQHKKIALLFIDLDGFKRINDSLGHLVGDAILCAIAERVRATTSDMDTCAHLSADEFAVLLTDLVRPQRALAVANDLLLAINQPLTAAGRQFDMTASIGISLYPEDCRDYDSLIGNADTAMHHAKEAGRNTVRFYAASMNAEALHRLNLDSRLRRAIDQNELLLHYQPLVRVSTGRVTDAEALIRWRGSDGKFISPVDFIPLAEETGLIIPIGEWVLRTACAQTQAWTQEIGVVLRIAVNLSARQFRAKDLVKTVVQVLADTGLPASQLKLEITESALMEDAAKAASILLELKRLGVTVSIDDFGTGYSSLAYLRQFPIDQLKIDRAFVQDVTRHADSAVIAKSVVELASQLRLETVGEGVETQEQQAFLQSVGCDLIQGYLFSRPLPAEEFAALLRAQMQPIASV